MPLQGILVKYQYSLRLLSYKIQCSQIHSTRYGDRQALFLSCFLCVQG